MIDAKRFLKHVTIGYGPSSCWLWTGGTTPTGYGRFWSDGKLIPATHAAWLIAGNGEVPEGFFLCHHCDNTSCVNAVHLFLGTQSENMKDASSKKRLSFHDGIGFSAVNAAKTYCKWEHPLFGENLYVYPDGERGCRACMRLHDRSRRSALKAWKEKA